MKPSSCSFSLGRRPPRSVETIDAELKGGEEQILRLLKEITA
jgi:hypothetical protein